MGSALIRAHCHNVLKYANSKYKRFIALSYFITAIYPGHILLPYFYTSSGSQAVSLTSRQGGDLSIPFSPQRVLEADAAEDAYHDDEDYDVDTPKKRHRGKSRVGDPQRHSVL